MLPWIPVRDKTFHHHLHHYRERRRLLLVPVEAEKMMEKWYHHTIGRLHQDTPQFRALSLTGHILCLS